MRSKMPEIIRSSNHHKYIFKLRKLSEMVRKCSISVNRANVLQTRLSSCLDCYLRVCWSSGYWGQIFSSWIYKCFDDKSVGTRKQWNRRVYLLSMMQASTTTSIHFGGQTGRSDSLVHDACLPYCLSCTTLHHFDLRAFLHISRMQLRC